LDRLESALAGADPDPITRAGITARLRGLAAQWAGADPTPDGEDVTEQISSASTDEILAFIDHELGRINDR
jgi:hypothetical protein